MTDNDETLLSALALAHAEIARLRSCITLPTHNGQILSTVTANAQIIANISGRPVCFDHNGRKITVNPKDAAQ